MKCSICGKDRFATRRQEDGGSICLSCEADIKKMGPGRVFWVKPQNPNSWSVKEDFGSWFAPIEHYINKSLEA